MQSKKGLLAITGALVAVVAVAAVAYNALGSQGGTSPLSQTSTSASQSVQATQAESSDASGEPGSASGEGGKQDASVDAQSPSGAQANAAASTSDAASSDALEDGGASDAALEGDAASAEPTTLADFSVTALDGSEASLSDMYGKPTLLGIWATWCPPCNAEAPTIQKLYDTYGDRVNFMMVDVASDGRDNMEIVQDWVAEGGYTYPIYVDQTGDAATATYARYLPTTIILDKDGTVLTGFTGALEEEAGVELMEQLIALG